MSSFRILLGPLASATVRPTLKHLPPLLFSPTARFPSRTFASYLDRLYTPKHEWINVNDTKTEGTVGITKHAEEALGDVVYVELPEVGTYLKAGEAAGAIESVKAASDIYSPISGEVVDKNSEIETKPHLINKSCYEKGWLYKLKIDAPEELEALMTEEAYTKYIDEETKGSADKGGA